MQEIAPQVLVETGFRGVNVGAISTSDGLVCIDFPTLRADAQSWIRQLRAVTGQSIRYLILTDYHIDRAFSTPLAQTRVIAHEKAESRLKGFDPRFPTQLLDSMSIRYNLTRKELNGATVIRPQVSFCDESVLRVAELELVLVHRPSATPASIWAYHPATQVLFTGDTVVLGQHPPLADSETSNWLAALTELGQPAFPVSRLVPGRGPVCHPCEVQELVAFLQAAQQRVLALYNAGRPRADTTSLVSDFMDSFPHENVPPEWLQRQLKAGLDHLYDEFKLSDASR